MHILYLKCKVQMHIIDKMAGFKVDKRQLSFLLSANMQVWLAGSDNPTYTDKYAGIITVTYATLFTIVHWCNDNFQTAFDMVRMW